LDAWWQVLCGYRHAYYRVPGLKVALLVQVCLSLLGTYDGPRWTPGGSLYQVLVSIQGMILGVTHPIYNEPGLGGFESQERGPAAAHTHTWHVNGVAERNYDERVQMATMQHAMLAHLKTNGLPEGFEDNVRRHFAMKRGAIMYRVAAWIHEVCAHLCMCARTRVYADVLAPGGTWPCAQEDTVTHD